MKPAVHAACENKWASSGTPLAGGCGMLVFVWMMWSLLGPVIGLSGVAAIVGFVLVAAAVGVVYHLIHGPGSVVAGDDGVEVRWGRRHRFIRYRDIEKVVSDDTRFRVVHVSGEIVPVRLRGLAPRSHAKDTAIVKRMTRRIGDPKLAKPLAAADPFARGDRDAPAWLDAIARRLPADGAYRGPPLDREILVRILKSGRAAPTARAAAAWLLRTSGFEEGEEEIVRDAARATASKSLEEALTAIATATTSSEAIAEHMARVPATP